MSSIGVTKLEKSFGARTLFEDVSLLLTEGHRYGLVGANGSGKTTFLKILAGDEAASDGSVNLSKGARLGVLRQDRFLEGSEAVIALAMQGDDEVMAAQAESDAAHAAGDTSRAIELDERLRILGAATLRARAASVLEGLGIPAARHERPLRELSGGMQLRVLLAQVLVGRPDVLLLDEPTNHLDILSIRWLERFLAAYEGVCVVISHDQRFLDNVVSDILDVDFESLWLYRGNYSAFVREKEAMLERKETENARKEEIIAEKRAFVERFRAKASKARQAQSRLKQLEKIEVEEIKATSRRTPRIKIVPERPSGRDVLTAEGVAKSYGEKRVLSGVSLTVRRGERIGVIGANGLGKSTLLRILAEKLDMDAGKVVWGHEARVGYFPQDHKELFPDPRQTVLDFVWNLVPLEGTSFVRGALGALLFSGDDVDKKIESLSGGEAARVILTTLAVKKPNVLLLDEPTNHLDVESIQALAHALKAFEGTVLFVSHNRWFVSELATRIVEVKADGIVDFPGTYDEYLARCGDDHLDAGAVLAKSKEEAKAKAAGAATDAGGWEEQKKRRNRLKALRDKTTKVTAEIDAKEARLAAIRQKYVEDGFFERTPSSEVEKLAAEEKALEPALEALIGEWEAVETEIGELAALLGEG